MNLLDINGDIGIKGNYISFGSNILENSYGFRNNNGTIQYKSYNKTWNDLIIPWKINNNDIFYNARKCWYWYYRT